MVSSVKSDRSLPAPVESSTSFAEKNRRVGKISVNANFVDTFGIIGEVLIHRRLPGSTAILSVAIAQWHFLYTQT